MVRFRESALMLLRWRAKNVSKRLVLRIVVSSLFSLAAGSSVFADFDDVVSTPEATPAPQTVSPTPPAQSNSTQPEPVPSAVGQSSRPAVSPLPSKSAAPAKNSNKSQQTSSQTAPKAESDLDHNSGAPVNYSAQSLEGSLSQGRILLKGDVEIQQADAVMKSDVAEIFSAKGSSAPQRAVAKGRVSLFKSATAQSAELRAVANELEYFMASRRVILKGKPKIWRGRELLQGEVIEVFLETSEIKVRGARGVMDPSSAESANGNPASSGVKAAPVKKSSGQNRR